MENGSLRLFKINALSLFHYSLPSLNADSHTVRELSERIGDELHARSKRTQKKKPRALIVRSPGKHLSLIKLRRPCNKKHRSVIRQQLQFLPRNLKRIEEMLTEYPSAIHWVVTPLLGIAPFIPTTI